MNAEGRSWLMDRIKDWGELVDLFFEIITCTLKKQVKKVCKVDKLIDPRDGEKLDGFLNPLGAGTYIFIQAHPENKSIEGRTLLHEILHINFEHKSGVDDPVIEKLALALWNEFSESQRRMLIDFIPEELSNERPMCPVYVEAVIEAQPLLEAGKAK